MQGITSYDVPRCDARRGSSRGGAPRVAHVGGGLGDAGVAKAIAQSAAHDRADRRAVARDAPALAHHVLQALAAVGLRARARADRGDAHVGELLDEAAAADDVGGLHVGPRRVQVRRGGRPARDAVLRLDAHVPHLGELGGESGPRDGRRIRDEEEALPGLPQRRECLRSTCHGRLATVEHPVAVKDEAVDGGEILGTRRQQR